MQKKDPFLKTQANFSVYSVQSMRMLTLFKV